MSRTEIPRKTKIGTEVAHVTRDSDTIFKVKRSKVKVTSLTRPLCSPPCWRVRRLQRWAWERVGHRKLLLRCRLLGGARPFGVHGGRRGVGAYRGGRPPTACYYNNFFLASVGIFSRNEKINEENWSLEHTLICVVGWQKTVVQKHRVKALNGDWNALKQKLRLSVLPAARAKFADPNRTEKNWPTHW